MPTSIKPILVTGSHRSGTTFVGKMLSLHQSVAYIQEPFNPDYGIEGFDTWYTYTRAGAKNEPHIAEQIQRVLRGTARYKYAPILESDNALRALGKRLFKSKGNLRYQAYKFPARSRRALLKDPIAVLSTEWLHKRFRMDAVILVRHPAGFVASVKRLNDVHPLSDLLAQHELMKDWLEPYEAEIRAANSLISETAVLWKCIYSVITQYCARNPRLITKRHEDLSLSPIREFRNLYKRLSLPFDSTIERAIRSHTGSINPVAPTGNKAHVLKRNSAENAYRWKELLTRDEISEIRAITGEVADKFYSSAEW